MRLLLLYLKNKRCLLLLSCFCSLLLNVQTALSNNQNNPQYNTVIVNQGSSYSAQHLQWFHQGLEDFLAKRYIEASQNWLKSAKEGHAKSNFNLGLMWKKGQVDGNVDQEKARHFFKAAYDSGYAPAKNYINTQSQTAAVLADEPLNKENKLDAKSRSVVSKDAFSGWSIQLFASKSPEQVMMVMQKNR